MPLDRRDQHSKPDGVMHTRLRERTLPTALWLLLFSATAAAQTQTQTQTQPQPASPPAPTSPGAAPALPVPDQTPIIDFPGQYAARPKTEKFPVFPKGCSRLDVVLDRLACADYILADWPRLGRFAAANAALAPAKPGEKRVVFFGDSITDNWSKKGYGGFFPGKPYVNRGIGGQTTAQMLLRFRADVIALKPAAVVILAGTNDIAGNTGPVTPEVIQNNLMSMTELAQVAGIRVVLASILPISDEKRGADGTPTVRSRDRPPETIRSLNGWLAAFAKRKRAVYLDYHAALADPEGNLKAQLNDDGLHPNSAGYTVMAPLAEKAIGRALGR
jgi:lysophospholipase L1-like esterase